MRGRSWWRGIGGWLDVEVLRGGNTKTMLTGSPRYYWVVSRMCT